MAANSVIPGFYGKLPILGDFVSRRLPRSFIDAWDQWLQSALAASREQLGAGWLDVYLTSPLWRFALSPGLCGESAWVGVLMPSVDKVGRYFPFTMAAPVARSHMLPYIFDSSIWFDDLEDLALSGLEDGFKLDEFDERLQRLALPEFLADSPSPAEAGRQAKFALQFGMKSQKQTGTAFIGMSGALLKEFLPTFSLWDTEGSKHIAASLLVCEGLPPADTFVALMTGQWQQRGWSLRSFSLPQVARRESQPGGDDSVRPALEPGAIMIGEGRWRSCGISVAGKKRELNEDALIERPDIGLWAVADGMGGHLAGEVASRNIVEALAEVKPSVDLESFIEQVKDHLQEVNTTLRQMAARDGRGQIIGSTVVVLLAVGDRCAVVWAGDSRLYRHRAGKLEQLTRDHSLFDAMISNGLLSAKQLSAPEHCNIITRAVGADIHLGLEVEHFDLLDGDRFLLCSDGLDKELSNSEIEELMAKDDGAEAAQALIDRALERGARDNVTVIVLHGGGSETDGKG